MPGRVTKNAIKGRKGFQRTGRADPLDSANLGIPKGLLTAVNPAAAPSGYEDIHSAFGDLYRVRKFSPTAADAQRAAVEDTRRIAQDPETESDTLDYIASRSNDAVALASVARHRNTNATTLQAMVLRLDHVDYEDVICRIGENRLASPDTMRVIANSTSDKVKIWAAWHDNTPADCHVAFRDHFDAAVRQGTAENVGTPREVLFYMGNALYEGDGPCRTAAKSNANYPSVEDRLALAQGSSTPNLEREMLAWDTNAKVRKAAREYFGEARPSSSDLAREAYSRGLPRHVADGIASRKVLLEDRTAGAEES